MVVVYQDSEDWEDRVVRDSGEGFPVWEAVEATTWAD